jgi:IMP dehydrogenase
MRLERIPLRLTFDDVLLEPRRSSVARAAVDVSAQFTKKIRLAIPVISAAMDTVSDGRMAVALGKLGGIAVLHRNCETAQQVSWIRLAKKAGVKVAVAVGPTDIERARAVARAGADAVVVDCAHAHHTAVIQGARAIRRAVKTQLVVGNIATREAAREIGKFVDALKVGIGPGSICTTRVVAGVGVPQLSAIIDVAQEAKKKKIPVIADGGMRFSGDVVKALAAGASTVMLGGMLAGTKEAPGKLVRLKGKLFKSYRGMGSLGALEGRRSSDRYFQKGAKRFVPEGIEGFVPYRGALEDVVWQVVGGVRSGMGYVGARTIAELPSRARFVRLTGAGFSESHPHSVLIQKIAPNYSPFESD